MESYKLFQQEFKNEQERKNTLSNLIEENEQEIAKLKIKYHDYLLNDNNKQASETKEKIDSLTNDNKLNNDKYKLLEKGLSSKKMYKVADSVVEEADEEIDKLNDEVSQLEKEYNELISKLIEKTKQIRGYKNKHYDYDMKIRRIAKTLPEWAKKHGGNLKYYGVIGGRDKVAYTKRVKEPVLKEFDPYNIFL